MKKLLLTSLVMASSVQAASVSELERKVNILASEVESMKSSKSNSNLSIGGYGEIVFNDYAGEDENGNQTRKHPGAQWDTLRNVLYVGYKFSPKWSMETEIEIEHANKIYTEFREVRYHGSESFNAKAGLMLAPVGFINEMHEPPTFFGVSRPSLEQKIIPTTWRENGFGLYGKKNNLSYKVYIMNSLNADNFDSSGVRGGRQKGAKAKAGRNSILARVDYTTNIGLDFGVTYYTGKTNGTTAGGHKHSLMEAHAQFKHKGLKLRALFAQNDLDGKEISAATGNSVADKQTGYYLEGGYDVLHGNENYLAPYVRYETYNTMEEVDKSVTKDKSKEVTNLTYGLMYKPVDMVSFKLDYVKNTNKAKTGYDSVNFGIGWQF